MARGDLRPAPPIDESPDSDALGCASRSAIGPEHLQTRLVDRLEWQHELKTLVGRRLEVSGRAQRFLALDVRPVAFKTEQPGVSGPPGMAALTGSEATEGAALKPLAASRAQGSRAFTFELSSRKCNPFLMSNL